MTYRTRRDVHTGALLTVRRLVSVACGQEFVRESVLHVDDGGNDEDASAQRELRPCTVHEVVDRAVENAGDAVFLPSSQEDDEVGAIEHTAVPFFVLCVADDSWFL